MRIRSDSKPLPAVDTGELPTPPNITKDEGFVPVLQDLQLRLQMPHPKSLPRAPEDRLGYPACQLSLHSFHDIDVL